MLATIAIGLIGIAASAQQTHSSHYLYKGQRVEVPVFEGAALVYFRTGVMSADEVRQHYRCLREVRLDGRKADTLFAATVAIDGDYTSAVEELKTQKEVWDVEPVLGRNGEVPVSNVFYVKLRSADDEPLLREMAEANGARVEGVAFERNLWYTLSVDKASAADALTLSTIIGESGKVEDVDPGFVIEMRYHVNCNRLRDSSSSNLSHLNNIEVCKAWSLDTALGRGVRIAIIDQGIDTTHPEFSNLRQLTKGYDATTEDTMAVNRDSIHGTYLAGIIFSGHNNHQIAGIAPNAILEHITLDLVDSVLTETGCYKVSKAFSRSTDHADVVLCAWEIYNLSQVQQIYSSLTEGIMRGNFTDGRNKKGNVVIFSASNNGNGGISWPASADDRSIVVGGINNSNYSISSIPWTDTRIDIVAHGEDVYTTDQNHSYAYISGTSPAAAQVAGVAALMLSASKDSLSQHQIKRIMCTKARRVSNYTYSYTPGKAFGTWNNSIGYGKLNAVSAVETAMNNPLNDLRIREGANDMGEEYDSAAVSPSASQSVDIYIPSPVNPNYNFTELGYGENYTVVVRMHNKQRHQATYARSKVKVLWSTAGGTLAWNSSWTNASPFCYSYPRCGNITSSDTTQSIIAADSCDTVQVHLSIPHYEYAGCSSAGAPSYIDIIAYVEDGDDVIGKNASSCPIEWFVRANNQVAWRRYPLYGPVLPPVGRSHDNGKPDKHDAITSLSPNPTNSTALLVYDLPDGIETATIVVTSPMGMEVIRDATIGGTYEINLRGMSPGAYKVHLMTRDTLLGTRTLVVK